MKEIIVFRVEDQDPFLYKEVKYNFSLGDTVYYEFSQKEIEGIREFYGHPDCEGVICDKWIDIGNMKILWTVTVSP